MKNLFYSKSFGDKCLILEDKEASHAIQVLRKKEGDTIYVIDGEGSLYKCTISKVSKLKVKCDIDTTSFYDRAEFLIIAVAPTKNRDRLEWMIEKLVEIGVKQIILLQTKNTERTKTNKDRIRKKVLSAVKQSLRFYVPEVMEMKFAEVLSLDASTKYIAHCYDNLKKKNTESVCNSKLVLIGPEGDFTSEEVDAALEAGFISLNLGNFRLRTETAAIVAAARFR